jgi:hypothetical protein
MKKIASSLLLLILLVGCKSIRYVPVETTKTDSIYVSNVERDSIYLLDSIYIREKNDTVYLERWRVKYVERLSRDTLWKERVDSIRVPYPVEKSLTKWQSLKMRVGGYALGGASLLFLVLVGILIAKLRL